MLILTSWTTGSEWVGSGVVECPFPTLTTTTRRLPTWVPLSASDPLGGYANADNIETLGKDELGDYLGALSVRTMRLINQALAVALALPTPPPAQATSSQ